MQKNHAKRTALALFLLFAVTVSAQAAKIAEVIPIGHTVGIKMQAEGVLIVQLTEVQGADGTHSPAKEAGVQEGDVLCRAGETALHSNDDLQKQVALSAGQPIKLTLERGDAEKSVTVTPCRDKTGAYRIGVLARDSLAGIGTLTYVDPQTGRVTLDPTVYKDWQIARSRHLRQRDRRAAAAAGGHNHSLDGEQRAARQGR